MQLLQRREGGREGEDCWWETGAKMDDLKNTGFWRKVQGEKVQPP